MRVHTFTAHLTLYIQKSAHLFQRELELCSIKQELEQDLGVVLGVVQNLIFDLTQSLVVYVVGCREGLLVALFCQCG